MILRYIYLFYKNEQKLVCDSIYSIYVQKNKNKI